MYPCGGSVEDYARSPVRRINWAITITFRANQATSYAGGHDFFASSDKQTVSRSARPYNGSKFEPRTKMIDL